MSVGILVFLIGFFSGGIFGMIMTAVLVACREDE